MSIASNNDADTKSIESINNYTSQSDNIRKMSSDGSIPSASHSHPVLTTSSGFACSRNSALPPPLTSTEARIQTVELLSQIGENIQEVVAALSDLHTYWEHR